VRVAEQDDTAGIPEGLQLQRLVRRSNGRGHLLELGEDRHDAGDAEAISVGFQHTYDARGGDVLLDGSQVLAQPRDIHLEVDQAGA
jgi:hypothetical protein